MSKKGTGKSRAGIKGHINAKFYRAHRLLKPEKVFAFAAKHGLVLHERWKQGLLGRREYLLLAALPGFNGIAPLITGGEQFAEEDYDNVVTNLGLNYALDGNLSSTLYLVAMQGTPTVAAGDTASSHAGWTENQDYDETPRQTWTTGAASSQSRSNSTAVTLTCTTGSTFGGVGIISDSTKGGTTGTFVAGEAFTGGNKTLTSGESIAITYTLSASDN